MGVPVIASVSQGVAIGVGLWLVGLGLFMFAAPRRALGTLGSMGSATAIHFGELTVRIAAGAALVLAAPLSKFPPSIEVIGWFLMVSAAVLMVLPRRWHARYSTWWSQRIPVLGVRLIAPLSAAGGGALIWSMI